jgi:hypothetical protein
LQSTRGAAGPHALYAVSIKSPDAHNDRFTLARERAELDAKLPTLVIEGGFTDDKAKEN